MSVCKKVGKPSEEHASRLANLFPSTRSEAAIEKKSQSAYRFDPTAESVNIQQKLKKKSSVTRSRPYHLWVVVCSEKTSVVPKAGTRRRMKKDGRVKRLEFSRVMSKQEVKNVLLRNFPALQLTKPIFLKAQPDNTIQPVGVVGGGFPDGDEVLTIASKESLYVVEGDQSEV